MSGKKIIVIIIAAAVLGAGFYWFSQKQPKEYTGPVEKITVANTEEYSTLVWVAQQQGYFADNGLDVILKDYQAGKLAADALLAGEADISVSAEVVLVSNGFDHPDLRTLGTVDILENMELVARKDGGIANPGDLRGKRIGITKKSTGEFFLGTFLVFNGISIADVEIIDLKPREIVEAISKGDIDAGLTWPPNTFLIKNELGNNAISWPGQSGQEYNMILIAREKFIKDNTEAIERFLESIIQAEEYVKNNNKETKNFIREKYRYEPDYMDAIWPHHNFSVKLPQGLILTMEDQARWRIRQRLTSETGVPNYLEHIYMDALEKIKPSAVGIIH